MIGTIANKQIAEANNGTVYTDLFLVASIDTEIVFLMQMIRTRFKYGIYARLFFPSILFKASIVHVEM